jgi:hypothetical protein
MAESIAERIAGGDNHRQGSKIHLYGPHFFANSRTPGRQSVTIMSHAGFFIGKEPETPKKAAIATGFTLLRCVAACLNWAIDSARGDRSQTGFRQIRGGFTQCGVDRSKRGRR